MNQTLLGLYRDHLHLHFSTFIMEKSNSTYNSLDSLKLSGYAWETPCRGLAYREASPKEKGQTESFFFFSLTGKEINRETETSYLQAHFPNASKGRGGVAKARTWQHNPGLPSRGQEPNDAITVASPDGR